MENNIKIFILTFNQEVDKEYDKELYSPLVCGGNRIGDDLNYFYYNNGDNISNLNKYYSELTGEYWVWKNTDYDVIGFCHYRRWFVKNYKWDKLTKDDILSDLENYDIILPHRAKFTKPLYEAHKEINIKNPNYDVLYEDYVKVEEVLTKFFPDYAKSYNKVMNEDIIWTNNMFICKKSLANDYFEWLFKVCDKLMDEIDISKYHSRDTRIFGFIGERLLTTYVVKNNLNIKEYDILLNRKLPILNVIYVRFPKLMVFENALIKLLSRFIKF